jgi:large repetitive protein
VRRARFAGAMLVTALALLLGCAGTALAAQPVLTITKPLAGSSTGDQQPIFQGTSTDPLDQLSLEIFQGASAEGTPVQTLTLPEPVELGPEEATWELAPGSSLEPGQYTALAVQTNAFSEEGRSEPVTFTIDAAPAVSIYSMGSPTNDSKPKLSGTASSGVGDNSTVSVTIYEGASIGGGVAASGVVSRNGSSWEYTPTTPLAEGTYTAQATQGDQAGEIGGSSGVTFAVDTTPPAVSLNAVTSPTSNTKPTFTGGVGVAAGDEAGVEVFIYSGSVASGTSRESGLATITDSTWSYTPSTALPEGTYTARAYQRDDAGNVGESNPDTFDVITKGPTVTIEPVVSPTIDPRPPLGGSAGSASLDEPTVAVKIYEGSSTSGKVIASEAPSVIDGSWSYTPPPLKDGTYTAQAVQEDQLHNVGKSSAMTFTVDTPAPAVSITSPTSKASLRATQPTFSGSASDATPVSVRIYAGSTTSGTLEQTLAATVENGAWSVTALEELGNGFYTAQAEETDEAGNVGKSSPVTFTVTSELTLETAAFEKSGRVAPVSGPQPSFEGDALSGNGDGKTVLVKLYRGSVASGKLEREIPVERSASRWETGPVEALEGGSYAVQVEQENADHEYEPPTEEFQFTVDATAPQITLTSPVSGSSGYNTSQTLSGGASTEEGDLARITVRLYSGSSASGTALQTVGTEAAGQTWSATVAGLVPGTYTALAEQEDDVGNVGHSGPVTFTVLAPPVLETPSPPVASFSWFPAAPHTGEAISLVSTSTDASSAITSFGWALAGNDVFSAASSTISTSFATAGTHVVQLQVIDANGQSSVATEAITVSSPVIPLMQPFPVVRIAGSFSSSGAKIGMLTVLAPVGATVRVTCRGGGCPAKAQRLRATAGAKSKASTVLITFHRFERSLRTGAVLDVWVSNAGKIGKFTRFVIRRDKPPIRTDMCLNPAGITPLVCPTS